VAWDRAARAEARDFSRWLLVAGKPRRPHWRRHGEAETTVWASGAGSPTAATPYAASVRAHSETVLRGFYDFHRDAGTGPILNPFPLDRSRRGRRAHAHHNPMEPHRNQRVGLYRPTVPTRIPRSIPDEVFNELFARLPSHRDRALVAFYVSTGARASELLSATQGGVDPGRQLIAVVRKGSQHLQELPASTDAFVWLRLYQLELDGVIPRGRRQPLWWTLRRPHRPLSYHAAHRMFERVAARGLPGDAARAAAHGGLPDGRGSGAADRRAARAGPRRAFDHPAVPDAPHRGRGPPGAGPPRRADPPAGGAGAGAWLPARDPGGPVREPDVVTAGLPASTARPRRWGRRVRTTDDLGSSHACRVCRPPATDWPATSQDAAQVLKRLTRAPFALDDAGSQQQRRRGLVLLLEWLSEQPGDSWQDRWLASGADAAGARWRQLPA
jgi:integrase